MQSAIRKCGLIFIVSLLFHVAGSWSLPLIDRDEPRFAEASREMIERSDYVVPFFNDRYRFDKPPLTYWFQILSYRVLGENDFAARFPSAIAAALTAVLLFLWARRIGPERAAWWAAGIFTFCFQTYVHAKAAVADMWLVLFVTAAHWAGYELLRDRLSARTSLPNETPIERRWWWIFYLALAFAFLAKGPIGWTPLLAIAGTKFFLPNVQLHRRFLFFTGLALTLSLVALWGIPALVRTDGEFLRIGLGRHVVERSFGVMEGHGARSVWIYLAMLPFYFAAIFLTFFPWGFSLPWLARKLWRKRDPLDNYLIAGAGVIFLVFTFVQTKLPHYTLPALPLLALLLAKALLDYPQVERFVRRTIIGTACLGLFCAAATPFVARFFVSAQLEKQAGADVTPEMEFGAGLYREPSLVWYFRRHTHRWLAYLRDYEIKPFMESPGPRFVVVPATQARALFPVVPPTWKTYSARGANMTEGGKVDVVMLLKPD